MNPSTSAVDYFSIAPPVHRTLSSDSLGYSSTCSPSAKTLSDPSNPLLAYRNTFLQPTTPTIMTSSLLQLQTSASHKSSSRPQARPTQNMLHVTSDDSSSDSGSSSSSSTYMSCLDLARCSRCQRTASIDYQTGTSNMVQYGLNQWYCSRCATLVGWSKG